MDGYAENLSYARRAASVRAHGTVLFIVFLVSSLAWGGAEELPLPSRANPAAVEEVISGKRTVANAAWWGFNADDATEALQAALNSGAKTVRVPYMGEPWIVRPLNLRSRLEVVLDPGVVVLAKEDEFKGSHDSIFTARDASDITLRGYGATLRMRKQDYMTDAYDKAEWRMGVLLAGCRRVGIEGLRIESTGGDGVYVGAGPRGYCEDVVIRNCTFEDNYRQGISVIGAVNLLVENCILARTWGTGPSAGIDLEPNGPNEKLVNCVIRNCVIEGNAGAGILLYLRNLSKESGPISVLFEDCFVKSGEVEGIAVGGLDDDGPQGLVEFRNCTIENTGKEGAKVHDNSIHSALVRFVNCSWKNTWLGHHRGFAGPRVPIRLYLLRPEFVKEMGNVEFVDCTVFDDVDRPALMVHEKASMLGVQRVRGTITVYNPHGARVDLGVGPRVDVDLRVRDGLAPPQPQ